MRPGISAPLLVCMCFLLSACGGEEPSRPADGSADAPAGAQGEAPPAEVAATDLYFTSGEQFRKVARDLPEDGSELEAAAEALIDGPTRAERSAEVETQTEIPADTKLYRVEAGGDGTAVVEVSSEFTSGVPADPAERTRAERSDLEARLAQVTYTLTEFPEVKATKVFAAGEPVEPRPKLERIDFAEPERGPKRLERPRGESGSSVQQLQARLAELRYLPERAVDGVEGYRTQQAVIAFQSWRGLERDGVVGPATSAALAKASPPKPQGDGPSRRIEVHRERGVTLLISGGRVKRAIHVSTGAPGTETPSGSYTVFRKELRSWSIPFQTWLPYASYFNNGIAFHEYPDVPTFPASHGCVRVPAPEAKGLYRFAALDTTVLVF